MPSLFGFRKPKHNSHPTPHKSTSTSKGDFLVCSSMKAEPARFSLSQEMHLNPMATTYDADADPPPICPSQEPRYDHDLATKFSDFRVNDLELLLSMETQARMDALEERERQRQLQRPTRLRFDIPEPQPTPPPAPKVKSKSKRKSGWTLFAGHRRNSSQQSSNSEDVGHLDSSVDDEMTPTTASAISEPTKTLEIGSKVRLIRRPLPTHGWVRYIGPVDCYPGHEWIGVELESRVGKNDGSVKGKRYFVTDAQRGIFLLRGDLIVV